MKPVYQTFIDGKRGNCMQAVMASLFELSIDEVPNFIEFGDLWFSEYNRFIESMNYEFLGTLYNPHDCYSEIAEPVDIIDGSRFSKLQNLKGIKGYFYASCFSQKFYDPNLRWGSQVTHAVIVDRYLNIAHDPNPENKAGNYLRANEIGYNGILTVHMIEPK